MNLNRKIALMVAIPVATLVLAIAYGWFGMSSMQAGTDEIVDQHVAALVDEKVIPLLEQEVPNLQQAEISIRLMLEADRDVHQSLIAERAALADIDVQKDMTSLRQTHSENIGQAEARIAKAAEGFTTDSTKAKYADLC